MLPKLWIETISVLIEMRAVLLFMTILVCLQTQASSLTSSALSHSGYIDNNCVYKKLNKIYWGWFWLNSYKKT